MTTVTKVDYLGLARRYGASPDDWPLAPRFNPHRRWYHRLAADPHGEAWILTWLPGQGTDLHDHGGAVGAFFVVSGTLTERTVGTHADRLFHGGQGRAFGAHHIHQVTNHGTEPAISVHVYSPALSEMTRYRVADGRLVVTAIDRAGADW